LRLRRLRERKLGLAELTVAGVGGTGLDKVVVDFAGMRKARLKSDGDDGSEGIMDSSSPRIGECSRREGLK
jgi:hypothetical protein